MRGLLILVLLAAAGWSGYWWVGSTTQETALNGWLQQQREAGWIAEVDDLTVKGYPNRFDSILTGLHLSDPVNDWTWEATEFDLIALSYQPNHIIAKWQGEQNVNIADLNATINSEMLRGSLVFEPQTSLALRRVQLEARGLTLVTELWNTSAETANIAFFASEIPNAYNLFARLKAINLPTQLQRIVELVELDATLGFDIPWDRDAVEGTPPALQNISIHSFNLVQEKIRVSGDGDLLVDPDGFMEGTLEISVTHWRDVLQTATETGAFTADQLSTIEQTLTALTALSGTPNTIKFSVNFYNQTTYLGIIPVGPAPQLILRE